MGGVLFGFKSRLGEAVVLELRGVLCFHEASCSELSSLSSLIADDLSPVMPSMICFFVLSSAVMLRACHTDFFGAGLHHVGIERV